MFTTYTWLKTISLSYLITTVLFIFIMNILRKQNFHPNGFRKGKTNWRKLSSEELGKQVEYHNNATYKAFEMYLKCLLALFGGIAFISTNLFSKNNNYPNQINQILLETAGLLIGFLTLIFCILIFVHQKSKIERWKKGFSWYSPLVWNECWFTSTAVTVLVVANFFIIPKLNELLVQSNP